MTLQRRGGIDIARCAHRIGQLAEIDILAVEAALPVGEVMHVRA